MDGNGRWAKDKGLPRLMGHKRGVESVRKITEACGELEIKHYEGIIVTTTTFTFFPVPFGNETVPLMS